MRHISEAVIQMNDFVKIKSDIDEATAKKVKKLLKKLKKSQDKLIEHIAVIILNNMDDKGAIFLSESMIMQIREGVITSLNEMNAEETAFVNEVLEKGYLEAYDKTAKHFGISADWKILRKEFVDRAIAAVIDGKNYSDRIWENTNELANRIYNDILDCIRTGRRPNEIARKIKKDFGVTAYQATRLVNTELARVVSDAQLEVYRNSGVVNKVLFTATLEGNTCEICGDLDGKYFNLNNAPKIPIHPNCRCCHIPVVDDWKPGKRADNETKQNIKYKTFSEWKNN